MATKGTLSNPEGPHLSEANFRRWEPILEEFLSIYPSPFKFQPTSITPSTACVSIRNAVNALLTKGFQTYLDPVLLREVWKLVSVRPRGNSVIIGTREAQQEVAISIARSTNLGPRQLTINNPTEQDLLALCQLLTSRAIIDPISLTGTVPVFVPPPGIVLEPMPDGTFTIL